MEQPLEFYKLPRGINSCAPTWEKLCTAVANTPLTRLDLMVREAIQNSLDAASTDENPYVEVDVFSGHFENEAFCSLLGDSGEESPGRRLSSFLNDTQTQGDYLAFRDKYTVGLNGDIDDERSNLHRIYGFLNGKGAEDSGAGGSYGVGKTVFLRAGLGFVVYYSRVSRDRSVLFVYYCQNDNANDVFIDSLPTRIAFWGKNKPFTDDNNVDTLRSCPLEDSQRISEILGALNIPEYAEDETGTTIIIPFVSTMDLLKEWNDNTKVKPFCDFSSLVEYLVMKWFFPRCRHDLIRKAWLDGHTPSNAFYPFGKYLRCLVGPTFDKLNDIDMTQYPLFEKFRTMYDNALSQTDSKVNCFKISIYGNKEPVGYFVYSVFDRKDACFLPLASDYDALFAGEDEQTAPQRRVVFCRNLGMVLNYDDNKWESCLNAVPLEKEQNVLGFFVANSHKKNTINKEEIDVDELFRRCEKADHYDWPTNEKVNGKEVVKTIVRHIGEQIKTNNPTERIGMERNLSLAHFLGRLGAMGTEGENQANGNTRVTEKERPGKASSGGGKSDGSRIEYTQLFYEPMETEDDTSHELIKMTQGFIVKYKAGTKFSQTLELAVLSSGMRQPLTYGDWQDSKVSEEFPLRFVDAWSPNAAVTLTLHDDGRSLSVGINSTQDGVFYGRMIFSSTQKELKWHIRAKKTN